MINCLSNYIGLRSLPPYEDPDSGYYLNDLQGITTQQLEDISDDTDHYEVRLAWDDIYIRASRLLESDIKNALKKYFKRYSYIDNGITGQIRDNISTIQNNYYNGIWFNLGLQSKNMALNISSVDISLNTAVNFDLFIYDLNSGKLLDQITYTGTAGIATYRVNKTYAVHRYSEIFICYDASAVSVLKMDEYKPLGFTRSVEILKTASIIGDNSSGADTGMSVTFNLECSISNFVCQRIDSFKDAFLYKLGVEFCNERIYSDRINRYTLMDREEADKLRSEFNDQYQLLIDAALEDLRVVENDICFECNRATNYKTLLP